MLTLDLQTVEYTTADRVARIVLNRPEALNAWTRELGDDMRSALEHAANDPQVRAIVFTGAGRAFSSGADLKSGGEFSEDGKPVVIDRLRESYNPLISLVRSVSQAGDRLGQRTGGGDRMRAGAGLRSDRRR